MITINDDVLGDDMAKMTITFEGDDAKTCTEAARELFDEMGIACDVTVTGADKATVASDEVGSAVFAELSAKVAHNARDAGRPPAMLFSSRTCKELGKSYAQITWNELEGLVATRKTHAYEAIQTEAQLYRLVTSVGGKTEEKVVDPRTLMRRMNVVRAHSDEITGQEPALELLNKAWDA